MKVYYLRFTQDDFIKSGSVWTTPVVDLYANSHYKNYSTIKSLYGTDLLSNGTWTGLRAYSDPSYPSIAFFPAVDSFPGESTYTEVGFVDVDRFVDTTGRIDIVDWNISYSTGLAGSLPLTLTVRTSSNQDNSYLGDWTERGNLVQGNVIYEVDSNRYAFFEIDWNTSANLNAVTCELLIRIEIDSPAVSAYFPETIKLQNKLPEWMAMREYDPSDPLSQNKSTPSSLGGKFLNAAAGEWLNDISGIVTYTQFQSFIETVDLTQKAWIYKTDNTPKPIWSIKGDGVELSRVASISEFYKTTEYEDAFFWNENSNSVFCNKKYITLTINGVEFPQGLYHTWNSIDDIGVTVDLFRLSNESNEIFKKRILDVYKNRPGVGVEAFKKALRRELNLWKYSDAATPDSNYLGATPEILEISDLELDSNYFEPNGIPRDKFLDLIDKLAIQYPMTWGYFKFGHAFWDADGTDSKGTTEVPKRFDADPPPVASIDSGVGDGNDLYILRPGAYTGARDFTARLKIRGRSKQTRLEYPGLILEANIYGIADDVVYNNNTFTGNYTLELTIGGIVYFHNFTVKAKSNQNYYQATPSFESYASFSWLNEGFLTNYGIDLKRKSNGASFVGATPSQASVHDITLVTIQPGHWDVVGANYVNAPSSSDYRLWFSDNSSAKMGSGAASFLTITNFNISGRSPTIVVESLHNNNTGTISNAWQSTKFRYTVKINGAPPANSTRNFVISAPPIPWPSSTTNRRYMVEIVTSDGTNFGAYTDDLAAQDLFVPDSIIRVNNSSIWTDGKQSFASSTTQFTFSTGTSGAYPASSVVWAPFESSQIVPFTGTVDENGPWRNGKPQFYGNVSYVLDYFNLKRSDFGVPDTTDYIVTWIGVDSVSDSQVIVWTETNTVKPSFNDPSETHTLEYPPNAIIEELEPISSSYQYNGIIVKARYKPGVVEQWYPKAYSGYFYDDSEEYYMYANRKQESATGSYKVLPGLNRLGAPVIVQGVVSSTPTTSATPVFSAQMLSGLTAWYDAANVVANHGSQVSTWIDSHTTARHISAVGAAGPVYRKSQFPTGLPGLYFNGTDSYLGGNAVGTPQLDALISTSAYEIYTVFIIHSANESNSDTNSYLNEAVFSDQQGVIGLHVSSSGPRLQLANSSAGFVRRGTGINITYNEPHVALIRHEGPSYYLSVDGGPEVSVSALNTDLSSASNALVIARNRTAENDFLETTIGEIAFYNTNHLLADRNALINALMEKWIIPPAVQDTVLDDLRQVYLWENDATPDLSHNNVEYMYGTGYNVLYAAYDNIYNITVTDLMTNREVLLSNDMTSSNEVNTLFVTDKTHLYEVRYRVAKSFYVDNEYVENKQIKSSVHFDSAPDEYGFDRYDVHYESSKYDPATPIDIPLNTFYTSIDEGFIYIDHDVHDLARTELRIDPGKIMADGYDYALVTIRTFDKFGNPKPYQVFNLYTNFGTFDRESVTTDRDGFGYAVLQSYKWGFGTPYPTYTGIAAATPNLSGSRGGKILIEGLNISEFDGETVGTSYLETIEGGEAPTIFSEEIDGGTSIYESPNTANVEFSIYTSATPNYSLAAIPSAEEVPANGVSEIYIYGQVKNSAHQGVPAAVVNWRKDRYLYDLFRRAKSHSNAVPGKSGRAGKVVADAKGRFRIGPFVAATPSDPGTWLVAVESNYATPVSGSTPYYDAVGDIVYWYEYTDTSFGVENIYGVPKAPVQYATPSWSLPSYSYGSAFPVRYDEGSYQATPEDPGIIWTPPSWYSVDRYKQYQMGILGSQYWTLETGATPNMYPDYKEF